MPHQKRELPVFNTVHFERNNSRFIFLLNVLIVARRKATCYTWLLRQEFLFSKNLRKGFLLRVSMCIIILEVLANRVKQEKEKEIKDGSVF